MSHSEKFDVCESDNVANGVNENVSMYIEILYTILKYRDIGHNIILG